MVFTVERPIETETAGSAENCPITDIKKCKDCFTCKFYKAWVGETTPGCKFEQLKKFGRLK